MPNARLATIHAAQHTTRELRVLFGRLGTEEHPRGAVKVAYANAKRALRDVLGRYTGILALGEAREVLVGLRQSVEQAARENLAAAEALGQRQAMREAEAWGLTLVDVPSRLDVALRGMMSPVDAQIDFALTTIALEVDPALIIGDDTREGALRSSEVTKRGNGLLAAMAILTMAGMLWPGIERAERPWSKQAIAAIDERTTDCCLQVHGQIVPMDSGLFRLTGTPRYADEMEWTPFHDHCRTSIVTVPTELSEDELTAQMRDAARAELQAREETGERVEIHPAHARSRR